jgi:hypothetical protein
VFSACAASPFTAFADRAHQGKQRNRDWRPDRHRKIELMRLDGCAAGGPSPESISEFDAGSSDPESAQRHVPPHAVPRCPGLRKLRDLVAGTLERDELEAAGQ